jgi:2-polyprenyl-3-methyl-5-hydroxy-6-metoxy-1,4-benzoquinol methylase
VSGSDLRGRWRGLRAAVAPPYWLEVIDALGDARSVLDVGCGSDSPLARHRARFDHLAGVDAYPAAVEAARAGGAYDELHEHDVRRLDELWPPDSFDAVAAVDLLEHLDREDGAALLDQLEGLARHRVVLFTPNGFVRQSAREGNPFQVHLSGWTAAQLRARGYTVRGVHGLRPLRGAEAQIRLRPRRAWALVADMSQPVVRRVPHLAYHLLAVKEVA